MQLSKILIVGTSYVQDDYRKKCINVSNAIALILIGIGIVFVVLSLLFAPKAYLLPFFGGVVAGVFIIFLNFLGFYNLSRILVCAFPITLASLYQAFLVQPGEPQITPVSICVIGFSMFSFLVFDTRETTKLVPILIYCLILILFQDFLNSYIDIPMDSSEFRKFYMTTITLITVLSVVYGSLFYLLKVNVDSENSMTSLFNEVEHQKQTLVDQNDRLAEEEQNLKAAILDTKATIAEAVEFGNLSVRLQTDDKSGDWKSLAETINSLFDTIVRPFDIINRLIGKLAQGDLTDRYEEEAKGDIGKTASNLNTSLDNLSSLLGDITEKTIVMESSSRELATTSDQMNLTTSEISSGIQEMSNGAHEQSVKVDDSYETLENVLNFSQNIKEQVESIEKTAKNGVEQSQLGTKAIELLNKNIQVIADFSLKSTDSMRELSKRSGEISQVLKIIKDVAAQTNLLALNAAIEAAQAGDAGRGFAVVAEEIRKLAEDSKDSVTSIEELISGIQNESSSSFKLVSEMNLEVQEGQKASEDTKAIFKEIASYYDETLHKTKLIVEATADQTNDIKNAASSIQNVSVIASQSSSGAEEIANAANELASGMADYSAKSKEAQEILSDLRLKVSQFKLSK